MNERLPQVISEQLDQGMSEESDMTPPNGPVGLHARRKPPKPWYMSNTIRLHGANATQAVIVLVINFLSTHPDGAVTKAELVALLVSAVTIVLRVLTDQPIEGGPKS